MQFVIDASAVGSFILPDEQIFRSQTLEDLMLQGELIQPPHWPVELCNLVLRASRQGRLSMAQRTAARDKVTLLTDMAEIETRPNAMAAFDLAVEFQLSVYDAAYLELAIRRRLPLLTRDSALANVLHRAGVEAVQIS